METLKSKGKVVYFAKSKYYNDQFVLSLEGVDKLFSIDSYKVRTAPKRGDVVGITYRGKFIDDLVVLQEHVPDIWEDEQTSVSDDEPF
jgi:hypothetical protein